MRVDRVDQGSQQSRPKMFLIWQKLAVALSIVPMMVLASQLSAPAKDTSPALTERVKIERLIETVAKMDGATFIRNGSEHSVKEAADHLRRKWQAAGSKISTAEQFIEHLASKSSLSGKPYQIRMPDKSLLDAGPLLRDKLKEIESGK